LDIDGYDRRTRSLNMQRTVAGKTLWNDTTVRRLTAPSCIHTLLRQRIYSCTAGPLTLFLYLCPCVSLRRGWLIRSCPWRFARWTDSNWQGFSSAVDRTAAPLQQRPTERWKFQLPPHTPQYRLTTTLRPLARRRRRHENFC